MLDVASYMQSIRLQALEKLLTRTRQLKHRTLETCSITTSDIFAWMICIIPPICLHKLKLFSQKKKHKPLVVSHRESWGGLLEESASRSCKLKSDWVFSRLATHGPGSFGWLNSLQNLPFQKGKSWLSKHRLKDGPTAAIMPRLNAKVSAEFVDCKAAGERWGTRTWRVQHKGFRSFIFVYILVIKYHKIFGVHIHLHKLFEHCEYAQYIESVYLQFYNQLIISTASMSSPLTYSINNWVSML